MMLVNTFKHVEVCASLGFLTPILTTWVDRMEQVSRMFPQGRTSYYFEQTLVGLLAGSAWAHGVPAITEAKIKRASPNSPDRDGRLDLLMYHDQKRIALEAKLMWNHQLIPSSIQHCLQTMACADVVSMSGDRADILLGGFFVVPWWDNDWQRENLAVSVLQPYQALQLDVKACCYDPAQDFPGAMLLAQIAS